MLPLFSIQKNLLGSLASSGIEQVVPGTHGNPPVQSNPAQSCCPVGVAVGILLGLKVGFTVGDEVTDVGFAEGKVVGVCDGAVVEGLKVGEDDLGATVGVFVGDIVGRTEEGFKVEGFNVGLTVGAKVGIRVVGMAVRIGYDIG